MTSVVDAVRAKISGAVLPTGGPSAAYLAEMALAGGYDPPDSHEFRVNRATVKARESMRVSWRQDLASISHAVFQKYRGELTATRWGVLLLPSASAPDLEAAVASRLSDTDFNRIYICHKPLLWPPGTWLCRCGCAVRPEALGGPPLPECHGYWLGRVCGGLCDGVQVIPGTVEGAFHKGFYGWLTSPLSDAEVELTERVLEHQEGPEEARARGRQATRRMRSREGRLAAPLLPASRQEPGGSLALLPLRSESD
jgi:hypothetical protein